MNFTIPKTLTAGDIVFLNLPISTETEYDYTGATTYTIGDIRKVSYESDGTTPVLPVKLFKALAAVSSFPPDHADPDNEPEWLDMGAVNAHLGFDGFIDTSSYADGTEELFPGKIVFELKSGRQNKIALFNVDATKVTFELKNSAGTVVDTQVYNLATKVRDWEEYFFKDFENNFDVVHTFPSYLVSTIRVTIEHEDVSYYPGVGFILLGINQYGGQEINEPSSGFVGFKTADDFKAGGAANRYPSQETMGLDLRIKTSEINKLQLAIAGVANRATLYEGIDNKYGPFVVLGVLQSYDLMYKGDRHCEYRIQIEGIK